jgi:hypothetical protein
VTNAPNSSREVEDALYGRQLTRIQQLEKEIGTLKNELSKLKTSRTVEHNKSLQIILYLVYTAYRYSPFKPGENIAKKISEDADRELDIKIGKDTIRDRINESKEVISEATIQKLRGST